MGKGCRCRCGQPWTGAEAAGMEERPGMMAVGGEEHANVQILGSTYRVLFLIFFITFGLPIGNGCTNESQLILGSSPKFAKCLDASKLLHLWESHHPRLTP